MRHGTRPLRLLLLIELILVAACSSPAEVHRSGSTPLGSDGITNPVDDAEPIPSDDQALTGVLENGLRYVVRANDRPGANAELRLVIDAGSARETADQSGAAHFLEHMLFNGTEAYPGNELIKTLESFGAAFGADINAYTSFDETVYELTVPLAQQGSFETALGILAEWLGKATIAEEDVIAERGVVLDEWRQSQQSTAGRITAQIDSLFLTGTPFDGRDPIGSEGAIDAMTSAPLRDFYDSWYRPDNASIVIVGDIDPEAVTRQLMDVFGGLEPRSVSPPRPDLVIEPYAVPAATTALDPDQSSALVELTLPAPSVPITTTGALRESIQLGLALDMIANRLADDAIRDDVGFTDATTDNNDIVRALDAPSVLVSTSGSGIAVSLDAVVREVERVRRFGFGPNELARSVASTRSAVDDRYDGRATIQDLEYADRYVSSLLSGNPTPDPSIERDLWVAVLDATTPADVGSALERRWEASAPHVLLVGPADAAAPTAAEVLTRLDDIAAEDLKERPDIDAADDRLMTEPPDPIEEVTREQLADRPDSYASPILLTFANGVRVVLNQTPISDRSVAMAGSSPGGLSVIADEDVADAIAAPEVVASSGLGALDQVQLEQVLGQAAVQLSPVLDLTSEDFYGSANTDDLEVLFQLIHLMMTQPRVTEAAVSNYVEDVRPYAEEPGRDPDLAGLMALSEARYGEEIDRFRLFPTAAELATLDGDTMLRTFVDRFGDAGDWVFAFSGDMDLDEATDLARTYLGTLPATGRVETWIDRQPDPPEGIVIERVAAGTGDRATLTVMETAPAPGDPADEVLAQLLTSILDSRLVEHLREQLGATYSPSAAVTVDDEPDAIVETYIQVTGAPAGMDELATLLQDDLDSLVADGPTPAQLDNAIEALRNQLSYFSNEGLIQEFLDVVIRGADFDSYLAQPTLLENLTVDDLQRFARDVLPRDRYLQVVVVPA